MKRLLNNLKELLIAIWKLLTKIFPFVILASILIDMWTDKVDIETIVLMLILVLDVLLDIRNNINNNINLVFRLDEAEVKMKGKKNGKKN